MPTYFTRPEAPAAVEHVKVEWRNIPGRGPAWLGTLTRHGARVCRFIASSSQKSAMARGERITITQDQIDAAARSFPTALRFAASPRKGEKRPAVLLEQAMRDWRSGRAFFRNGRYWIRPLGTVAGIRSIVDGRARVAPWSKVAIQTWGDTRGLHQASQAKYPRAENLTEFQRMHGMDPVASKLLSEASPLSRFAAGVRRLFGGKQQRSRGYAPPHPAAPAVRRTRGRGLLRPSTRTPSRSPLATGHTVFGDHLKIHPYSGSLSITDMTNAGKRGKTVHQLHVTTTRFNDNITNKILGNIANDLLPMTFSQAKAHLSKFAEGGVWALPQGPHIHISERTMRGIDVEPPSTKIELTNRGADGSILSIESSPFDFHVRHSVLIGKGPHRQDTGYWPFGTEAVKKKQARIFYDWLRANLSQAGSLSWRELYEVWQKLGIRYNAHSPRHRARAR